MLKELRISGFALMDGLSVLFEPGLNVLTGDTGAGKSTLVGALRFLSGGRGALPAGERREVVVEGLFFRDSADEEGVLLKRVGDQDGRTRAYVNDEMVTLARLRETASGLFAIQSQGEGHEAVEPHRLLRLLDGFLGLDAPRASYEDAWRRADAADRALSAAEASGSERAAELAELRRQKERIDRAAPGSGEAARLEEEVALLRRGVEVRTALETVYEALYEGEGSAVERLGAAGRALRGLSGIASGLDGLAAGRAGRGERGAGHRARRGRPRDARVPGSR
jgi:DNA repair protein RecN (Recombination protein N)